MSFPYRKAKERQQREMFHLFKISFFVVFFVSLLSSHRMLLLSLIPDNSINKVSRNVFRTRKKIAFISRAWTWKIRKKSNQTSHYKHEGTSSKKPTHASFLIKLILSTYALNLRLLIIHTNHNNSRRKEGKHGSKEGINSIKCNVISLLNISCSTLQRNYDAPCKNLLFYCSAWNFLSFFSLYCCTHKRRKMLALSSSSSSSSL